MLSSIKFNINMDPNTTIDSEDDKSQNSEEFDYKK